MPECPQGLVHRPETPTALELGPRERGGVGRLDDVVRGRGNELLFLVRRVPPQQEDSRARTSQNPQHVVGERLPAEAGV
jgi:hypothetical protein